MALMCRATTEAAVDRNTGVFAEAVAALAGTTAPLARGG